MSFIYPLLLSLCLALAAGPVAAEPGASWLRAANPGALNPKISVIADFVGQTGTAGDPSQTEDGFHLREVEIGVQADIDPYARADFFIGGMNDAGSPPELEEGYFTLLSLPGGFQARGGKFRANFGRLNMVHPHELPQVDSPLVLDAFLGEERLVSTGFELSRIFAPFELYTEASYALLQDLGATAAPPGHTITVTDQKTGLPVDLALPEDSPTPPKRLGNFAHVSKIRFYKDLSDTTNVDLGFSGALYQPRAVVDGSGAVLQDFDRKKLGAVDFTLRWKPLAQGVYRSAIWRTEILYTDQSLARLLNPVDGSEEAPAARIHRRGGYSYVELQPAKRWRAGLRGDYAEDPTVRSKDTPHIARAIAPYVTFTLTEFNRFRIQWTRKDLPGNEKENLGFLQWTVVLGPHGAHAF
ncbi:MAG TPA: hypothetical protein PLM37_01920 [Elusimicrobiota bacterium]|nr:hypothetical protein [Elusimicrobiota bacterium]